MACGRPTCYHRLARSMATPSPPLPVSSTCVKLTPSATTVSTRLVRDPDPPRRPTHADSTVDGHAPGIFIHMHAVIRSRINYDPHTQRCIFARACVSDTGEKLKVGIRESLTKHGLPAQVIGPPCLFDFFITTKPVSDQKYIYIR